MANPGDPKFNKTNNDEQNYPGAPPSLITKLRGLSSSRPASPDPRLSGSIASGKQFRSTSQTHSLSSSPLNQRDWKPSKPGTTHAFSSNPPSSSSSPSIFPVDRSKGWQPPTRIIQAKPSVELIIPNARFVPPCSTPKKAALGSSQTDEPFFTDEPFSEYKDLSDTTSVASMRLSRYTQAWKAESQHNFSEESNAVDSNTLSTTPPETVLEGSQLEDSPRMKPNYDKENRPGSLPTQERIILEEVKPVKRKSWWSFGVTTSVEPKKEPEVKLVSITGEEGEDLPEAKPNEEEPLVLVEAQNLTSEASRIIQSSPSSPWWSTFGFKTSSSTSVDLHKTTNIDNIACNQFDETKKEATVEAINNSIEVKKATEVILKEQPLSSPVKEQTSSPYPGSEPSYVTRSLLNMGPTWKYFFSKKNSTQLQKPSPKLVLPEESSSQALVVHSTKLPEASSKASSVPVEAKPSQLQEKPVAKASTHPNLVLPVLDVNSFGQTSTLLRYTLDRLYFYTGFQFSEQANQYSSFFFPPKVNKVVIIGVHGWFPLKFYQKMIGEPTGTSEKFCGRMNDALKAYLLDHYGIDLPDQAITQIPLSCEGKVEVRLNKLYAKLLSTPHWMLALTEAEHVLVAAHSQGTPVSVMLLSRLIRDGLLDPNTQRTCILAMAGVSHGPFAFLKENYIVKYFETEAARELFEFMNPNSSVVKHYNEAMQRVVESGVKICAVASLTDQVVPLYSGVMHGFSHPGITRALYIDGVNYTPDFLTSLIVFALLIRNYGHSDHDLILHLSDLVAGSLYSGTPGHSTVYEERKVYTTAIQWHFANQPRSSELNLNSFDAHVPLNPYFLPWIMRGLLEDPLILQNSYLSREIDDLRSQFAHWQPSTKLLKELQFRLEPIRSQLLPEGSRGR